MGVMNLTNCKLLFCILNDDHTTSGHNVYVCACVCACVCMCVCVCDANALSRLAVLRSLWNFGFVTSLWTVLLRVTIALPQEDLPAQGSSACMVHRHPSAGSLGGNSCVSYGCRRLCFVSMCVCALMSGDTPQENIHNNPFCPSTFTRPILL